jgi:hypothetical protein
MVIFSAKSPSLLVIAGAIVVMTATVLGLAVHFYVQGGAPGRAPNA